MAHGSNNPNTAAAAKQGRVAHTNARGIKGGNSDVYDVPYDSTEVPIDFNDPKTGKLAAGRVDAVDIEKGIIYELKPNNPAAIAKGQKQLANYIQGFGAKYPGKTFTGKIVIYENVGGVFKYTLVT